MFVMDNEEGFVRGVCVDKKPMRSVSVNSAAQKLGRRASDTADVAMTTSASPRKEARPPGHNPPLNVMNYQLRHMLNVMHTNPDCRYAPNSNKNLEKAMGYIPTLPAGIAEEQDQLTEGEQ
ncbi:hypothetical protein SprV_0602148700 [Sparganum proliferum]